MIVAGGGQFPQKCAKPKDERNKRPGSKTAESTMREAMKPSRQKKKEKVETERMSFLQKREARAQFSQSKHRKD